jgi:type II secretory pathway pseudopilin PulG
LFAALLVAGGALLASGAKHPWLTTAISILGALGLTSAGLYARAKAQLTSLLESLRLAVDKQRVREAATICPPPTSLEPGPKLNRTPKSRR